MNDPVIELEIQKAANAQLVRSNKELKESYDSEFALVENANKAIKDLQLKHEYQVRRADSAERLVFELREVLDSRAVETHELREELQLIKHILVEVGSGRYRKVPNPSPEDAAPTNVPYSAPSLGGETIWPSLPKKERIVLQEDTVQNAIQTDKWEASGYSFDGGA